MKKFLSGVLSAALAFGALPAFAAEGDAAAPQILYNNTAVETPVSPQIVDDRVLVPFRSVLETMGATVEYDHETRDVSAVRGDRTISFNLNGDTIAIDDAGETSTAQIEGSIVLSNDYTLIPLRSMSEALGMSVGWDNDYRTVVIVDTEKYIEDLTASTPNFAKLMETQAAYPESYTSTMEFGFTFDLGYEEDGTPKTMNMAMNITGDSAAKNDIESAAIKLDLDIKDLQEYAGDVDLSELMGITLDCITSDGELYIKTNLIEKLAKLFPEEEDLQTIAKLITSNTWLKIELADLYNWFGFDESMIHIIESAANGNFSEQMLGQFLETITAIQTGGVDSIWYANNIDTLFKTYKVLFSDKYTTITDKGENSYDIQMIVNTDAINEIITGSPDEPIVPEDIGAPQIDFSLKLNETVENGIGTSSTFEMTLSMDNSETENFSMTFSGSSSLDTEATVEDIELPSTALNIMDILGALGIIGGTVSGS